MKKNSKNMHKNSAVRNFLIRSFGDIPVRDAKKELRVMAGPEDIAGAVRGDPECCVFAQACKRLFHSRKVVFLRRIAYVELMQENGATIVERFQVTDKMRSLIERFDRTGECAPGGFVLLPPPYHMSLEGKRERDSQPEVKAAKAIIGKRNRANRQKARLLGTAVNSNQEKWRVSGERYGAGLVQFKERREAEK